MTPEQEVAALRALLRKVRGAVGWWASLAYVDGAHGRPSRWSAEEQELLHRAFGHVTKTGKVLTDADIEALADEAERGYDVSKIKPRPPRT